MNSKESLQNILTELNKLQLICLNQNRKEFYESDDLDFNKLFKNEIENIRKDLCELEKYKTMDKYHSDKYYDLQQSYLNLTTKYSELENAIRLLKDKVSIEIKSYVSKEDNKTCYFIEVNGENDLTEYESKLLKEVFGK